MKKIKFQKNRKITASYDSSCAVHCHNGTFVGKRHQGILCLKGIAYAKQPVGVLRWRAPEQAESSDAVYEAFYYGKSSLQPRDEEEPASFYKQGEDCLTLNLFINTSDKNQKKPIMVYFHGGSFIWGGPADPQFDGKQFVRNNPDVILVTVAFRLGMMGYINLAEFENDGHYDSGLNLSHLDQIAALRWIKRNAAAFGGDGECITIFGESAGGASVSILSIMPQARGLFQRVIAQSGSFSLIQQPVQSGRLVRALKEEFDITCADDLQRIPIKKLKTFWNTQAEKLHNFPTADGKMIPADPYAAWQSGATSHYDILQGYNRDEFRGWLEDLECDKSAFRDFCSAVSDYLLEDSTEEFRRLFEKYRKHLGESFGQKWIDLEVANDYFFFAGQTAQALFHAANGGRSYFYRFDIRTDKKSKTFRASHGTELAYIFGNFDAVDEKDTKSHLRVSRMMQRMWVNFAKTGDPSLADLKWPLYKPDSRRQMIFSEDPHVEDNPWKQRVSMVCDLMALNPKMRSLPRTQALIERFVISHPFSAGRVLIKKACHALLDFFD